MSTETDIVESLMDYGSLTLSELSELTGKSRSWVWKKVRDLESRGVVESRRVKGVLRVRLRDPSPAATGVLRVGILRAAEYPYIPLLLRRLRERYARVRLLVRSDPFRLGLELARGRVHLAMIPAITALLAHRLTRGRVVIAGGGSGGGAGIVDAGPRAREAHATTMASTMEACAEASRLPGERIYAGGGEELLRTVLSGKARYAVVWEPYLSLARRRGLHVEPCTGVEACCVLAAHTSMGEELDRVRRLMAESVSEARRRLRDPVLAGVYSRITGLPRSLVGEAFASYRYYEEPPVEVLEAMLGLIRASIVPAGSVRRAVWS